MTIRIIQFPGEMFTRATYTWLVCGILTVFLSIGFLVWGTIEWQNIDSGNCWVKFTANTTFIVWTFYQGGNLSNSCSELDNCVSHYLGTNADSICSITGIDITQTYTVCNCWLEKYEPLGIHFGSNSPALQWGFLVVISGIALA